MKSRPFQIHLSNLTMVIFWLAAACACFAAALHSPRPTQGLLIWPGMMAPCFLGAAWSFFGRPKTGIVMALVTGLVGLLAMWTINHFWFVV
jgi:hypothetical protein